MKAITILKLLAGFCLIGMIITGSMLVGMSTAKAEEIGSVNTTFKVLGANDKIVIEVFDDPDVPGVACYLSRAKTGGISGSIGLAEDTSDAGISCRKVVDKIIISDKVKTSKAESIFKKSTNIMFKKMQVVRFYDTKRNVLIYLTYSDKLIDGSPKNSISVVSVTVD